MWNEIEKRSIQALLKPQSIVGEKDFEIAYQDRDKREIEVLEGVSAREERILALRKGQNIWYLQSRYNAGEATRQWAKQVEDKLKSNSVIIVFGFGDGSHIRELLKYGKKEKIVVYEPCQEVFWQVFGREEVADILENERVYLLIEGISDRLLYGYLESLVSYRNFQLVQICVLPNYDRLFPKSYRNLLDQHLFVVNQLIFSRNTEIIYATEFLHNMIRLIKDVVKQYSVVQLEDIIEKQGLCGLPAVLVSAGPSLDKNIGKLKEIHENVFVMAVDTALNTVLANGIIPDMTITIDSHKLPVLFEDECVQKIPIAVSTCSNEKIILKNSAKHFYELRDEDYLGEVYQRLGKEVKGLPTGGSVANNALALLVLMGFKTIIFMGQDLAYPGGVRHAFDAYHMVHPLIDGMQYYEVEDMYGEKVLTESNMEMYRRWFEFFIALVPRVRFIDATEGGVKIHGTEICTMQQMVEEFSGKIYNKEKIFLNIEPYLNKEEQEKVMQIILGIPKRLEKLAKKIKSGLNIYDKMDQINRKSNGKSQTLGKLLNQVMELNKFIGEEPAFVLVRYYTIKVDYAVDGQVLLYDENAAMYEQIKGLIENGRILLKGYLEGVKECRKDIEEFLEDFI